MNKSFLLSGLLATVVNLVLHAVAFTVVLNDVYRTHPAVSAEFQAQLSRPMEEMIVWAMIATSIAMGFLIALVMKWSGARTFPQGVKQGGLFAFLFWSAVNFGLYSSSNHFSTVAVFADLISSSLIMTIAAACAAWVLGRTNG
ncbi:MAG: hypothetical protein KIT10_07010 [Flavobacteriales bacterium]|nr:hypothetical protein [Flavobacteriales bacterium]